MENVINISIFIVLSIIIVSCVLIYQKMKLIIIERLISNLAINNNSEVYLNMNNIEVRLMVELQ
jgi:hypothetical protein